MFSQFSSPNQEPSPEQLYQLALQQKTQLTQQLAFLQSAKNALTTTSHEEQLAMHSNFNIWSSMLAALDQNIQDLTRRHPHLLIPTLPSGAITGDHHPGPAVYSSSSHTLAFSNTPQLTFHTGVNTQASTKHEKRSTVKSYRK